MSSVGVRCLNAFFKGRKEEGLKLLNQLEDPGGVINEEGFTLLHTAAYHGWLDVVIKLVAEYNCDVNSKTEKNKTPVFFACRQGHLDVVKYLSTTCECDLNVESRGGNTPLSVARRNNHTDVVTFLKCKHL